VVWEGGRTFAGHWTKAMRARSIAERELVAAARGLAAWHQESKAAEGTPRYELITDNTNVVAWLTKRGGPNFFVNAVLRDLFEVPRPCTLSVTWIPSAENPADGPSRDPSKYPGLDWPFSFPSDDAQRKPRKNSGSQSVDIKRMKQKSEVQKDVLDSKECQLRRSQSKSTMVVN
jgi:hypothetical protein